MCCFSLRRVLVQPRFRVHNSEHHRALVQEWGERCHLCCGLYFQNKLHNPKLRDKKFVAQKRIRPLNQEQYLQNPERNDVFFPSCYFLTQNLASLYTGPPSCIHTHSTRFCSDNWHERTQNTAQQRYQKACSKFKKSSEPETVAFMHAPSGFTTGGTQACTATFSTDAASSCWDSYILFTSKQGRSFQSTRPLSLPECYWQ